MDLSSRVRVRQHSKYNSFRFSKPEMLICRRFLLTDYSLSFPPELSRFSSRSPPQRKLLDRCASFSELGTKSSLRKNPDNRPSNKQTHCRLPPSLSHPLGFSSPSTATLPFNTGAQRCNNTVQVPRGSLSFPFRKRGTEEPWANLFAVFSVARAKVDETFSGC